VEIDVPRKESERVALRVRRLLGTGGGPEPADPAAAQGRRSIGLWDRIAARVPVRVDPGRRSALAIGVAVVAAALVTGLWLTADRPRALALSATPPAPVGALVGATSAPSASAPSAVADEPSPAAASTTVVVVDVAGKVRRPGLYHLPDGARVDDAITAAGGARHGVDLSSLNLAARLIDGQQIAVGRPGAVAAAPAAAGAEGSDPSAATSSAPVALNTATIEQLETLPGVGPVTAQKILDWRSANGSFTSVDQLRDVSGIGDVRFAELHDLVTV
jgi:competence protein ComEA